MAQFFNLLITLMELTEPSRNLLNLQGTYGAFKEPPEPSIEMVVFVADQPQRWYRLQKANC